MTRLSDYLFENEPYQDGLKRALRLWSNDTEILQARVQELEEAIKPFVGFAEQHIKVGGREAEYYTNDTPVVACYNANITKGDCIRLIEKFGETYGE